VPAGHDDPRRCAGPVSAITLAVSRRVETASTRTVARRPARPSPAPAPIARTGIRRPGRWSVAATGRRSVSTTSAAAAPARWALSALSRKKHVPRRTSATSPSRSAPKSSAEQPRPAARTRPDAVPPGENWSVRIGRTRRPPTTSRGRADSR
jgi:hypothetical protein